LRWRCRDYIMAYELALPPARSVAGGFTTYKAPFLAPRVELEMPDDLSLQTYNPWWKRGYSMGSDQSIAKWEASASRNVPLLYHDIRGGIDKDRAALYTVSGSRLVGKTTIAKLLLRDLLARGVPPSNLCFLSLCRGNSIQGTTRAMRRYLDMRPPKHKGGRSYILIDEASMVPHWQNAALEMSELVDTYNCSIVVMGTHEPDTRCANRRFGEKKGTLGARHRLLLPMRFLESASLTSPALSKLIDKNNLRSREARLSLWGSLVSGEDRAELAALSAMSPDLEGAFRKYLLCGGLYRSLDEFLRNGKIDDFFYIESMEYMRYIWSLLKHHPHRLQSCMRYISEKSASKTSWRNMAGHTGVIRHTAAKKYAASLSDMYAIVVLPEYGASEQEDDPDTHRKIHVRDPFVFHGMSSWPLNCDYYELSLKFMSDESNARRLAESAVADHLDMFSLHETGGIALTGSARRVFCWHGEEGRSVDCVYRAPGLDPVPMSVANSDRVDERRLDGLEGFAELSGSGRGIVATRHEYDVRRACTLVPTPILLLLLS